jgi:ribosomal subunit interface protein
MRTLSAWPAVDVRQDDFAASRYRVKRCGVAMPHPGLKGALTMIKPVEVVFHGIERSNAVEEHVRDEVAKLERLHPQVSSCRVTIGLPHNRQQQGKRFDVRVELAVPGKELVVNRTPGQEDMYAALRDAFDVARRQLDDHARAQRGEVKHHQEKSV